MCFNAPLFMPSYFLLFRKLMEEKTQTELFVTNLNFLVELLDPCCYFCSIFTVVLFHYSFVIYIYGIVSRAISVLRIQRDLTTTLLHIYLLFLAHNTVLGIALYPCIYHTCAYMHTHQRSNANYLQ